MSGWDTKVWEAKRQTRKRLAALPFSKKIELIEQMRDRNRLIATSHLRVLRHAHHRQPVPA